MTEETQKKKFIKVTFSLTEEAIEILNQIYRYGPFGSRSEAVRHCIINNGIADYKLKNREKMSEKERKENMTNEEYLHEEFAEANYELVEAPAGTEVLFTHHKPNMGRTARIPLKEVKNINRDSPEVAFSFPE